MQHILSEIFYHAVSVFLACFRVTCSRSKGGENFWGQKSIPAIPVLPARSKSIPVLPIPALPERAQDTMVLILSEIVIVSNRTVLFILKNHKDLSLHYS